MIGFAEFYRNHQNSGSLHVVISVSGELLESFGAQAIEEAKKETVGRYDAYKHQPHFQGGEYHGHCDLPGRKQLSWTISGKRLHSNKFPADDKIPQDAKMAVANVLGVSVTLLEAYTAFDKIAGKEIFLIEVKNESKAARLLRDLLTT